MKSSHLRAALWGACLLSLTCCASHTKLRTLTRQSLQERHAGRTVALKQSCYYGDLYDDNDRWMLLPHEFSDVYHLVGMDGAPIYPGPARGIIPAGARFRVVRIEFPDREAMVRRMLTTPRYNPWVFLEPEPSQQGFPVEARPFVLVLPTDLTTEEAFTNALHALIGAPEAVSAWLSKRGAKVRTAIKHKQIVEGMTAEELMAAAGTPLRWFDEDDVTRVAWYPSREAWLANNRVVRLRPARGVMDPAPVDKDTSTSQKSTRPKAKAGHDRATLQ